jgi:hypothetical protein
MCPSTDATGAHSEFAAEVLRNLLRRIEDENQVTNPTAGHCTFLVSHAWTDGPTMYLVYKAPPSYITLGLVRDTRESNISPGPWLSLDEAVVYYYITDLEEGGGVYGHSDGPETILWHGDPLEEALPERPSDIPEAYRYTPPPASARQSPKQSPPVINEPRRYVDPR